MRATWKCKVAWAVLGFGWVTAIIASADAAAGGAVAWWWVFLGGATVANLLCVASASLVLWHMAAPSGVVWRVAELTGYERGRRDALEAAGPEGARVIPLQRAGR